MSLIILFFYVGCQQNMGSKYDVEISDNNLENTFAVADIFSEFEEIPLVTTQSRPIGKVLKIIYLADRFVILHHYTDYNQRYVSVFDREGKNEFDLEPNEDNFHSFYPLDIAVTEPNQFSVLEGNSNTLFHYSISGKLNGRQKLPFKAINFTFDPDQKMYAFHKNYQAMDLEDKRYFYNLLFTDTTFQVREAYFPFDIAVGSRTIVNFPFPLQRAKDGRVYFAQVFADSIYAFHRAKLDTDATIHLGLPGAVSSQWQESRSPNTAEIQEMLDQGTFLLGGHYAISDRFFSFNLLTRRGPAWGVWERHSGELRAGYQGLHPDGTIFPPFIGYLEEVGFLSVLNESSLQYVPARYLEAPAIARTLRDNRSYLRIVH